MARKDEEVELDKFDFDDDLDFDNFDFDSDFSMSDDRTPVAQMASSTFDGFKTALGDKHLIKNALGDKLPKGYHMAIDFTDDLSNFKDDFVEGMDPVKKNLQRLVRDNKALTNKILPKKWGEKLTDWASGDSSYSDVEEIDPREAEINNALGDIFQLQAASNERESERDEREATQFVVEQESENKRHEKEIDVLSAIRSGVDRQVNYQDQINVKYQQKNLEIQYRQLFALSDLLEVQKRTGVAQDIAFKSIIKNTALPEAQKVKLSEVHTQMLREKTLGKVHSTVGEFFSNYLGGFQKNLIKNTAGKLNDIVLKIGDGLGMASPLLGKLTSEGAVDDGMPKISPYEIAGGFLGPKVAETLLSTLGRSSLGLMEDSELGTEFADKGKLLEYILNNKEDLLKDFMEGNAFEDGAMGGLVRFIKAAGPTYTRQQSLESSGIQDADEAVSFTKKVERSIVEVIPGYLQRQLKVLMQIKDGSDEVDSDVFNARKGIFTKESVARKDMEHLVMAKDQRERVFERATDLVEKLDFNNELSPDAKAAARESLMDAISRGRSVTIPSLASKGFDTLSDTHREEVQGLLKRNFLNAKGQLATDSKTLDHANDVSESVKDLRNYLPNIFKDITKVVDAGFKDMLMGTGLIGEGGDATRIDYDQLWKKMDATSNKEQPNEGTSQTLGEGVSRTGLHARDLSVSRVQDAAGNTSQGVTASPGALDSIRIIHDGIRSMEHSLGVSMGDMVAEQRTMVELLRSPPTGSDNEAVLGELSLIKEALSKIAQQETTTKQLDELEQIKEWIAMLNGSLPGDGELTPGQSKRIFSGAWEKTKKSPGVVRRWMSNSFGFIRKRGGEALTFGKNRLDEAKTLVKSTVELGWDKAKDLGSWAMGKGKQVGDIHIKGRLLPALTKFKLDAGEYLDAKGNVIKSMADLENAEPPIFDKFTKSIVLTYEDIQKGLVTKDGKTIFGKAANLVKGSYDALYGFLDPQLRAVGSVLASAGKGIKDIIEREVDIYIPGEKTPRILAHLLKKGYYSTGTPPDLKPITSWKDIEGAVYDQDGKMVLSAEEMSKGLFDQNGNRIKELSEKAGDWIAESIALPFRMAGKAKDWLSSKFKGGGSVDIQMGMGGKAGLYLKDILKVLVAHTGYEGELESDKIPEKKSLLDRFKRKKGDSDDSGDKPAMKDRIKNLFKRKEVQDVKDRMGEGVEAIKNSKLAKGASRDFNTVKEAVMRKDFVPVEDGFSKAPFAQKGQPTDLLGQAKFLGGRLVEGGKRTKTYGMAKHGAEQALESANQLKDKGKEKAVSMMEKYGLFGHGEEDAPAKTAMAKIKAKFKKDDQDSADTPEKKTGIFGKLSKFGKGLKDKVGEKLAKKKDDQDSADTPEKKTGIFGKLSKFGKGLKDKVGEKLTKEKDDKEPDEHTKKDLEQQKKQSSTLEKIAGFLKPKDGPRKGSWQERMDAGEEEVDKNVVGPAPEEKEKGPRWVGKSISELILGPVSKLGEMFTGLVGKVGGLLAAFGGAGKIGGMLAGAKGLVGGALGKLGIGKAVAAGATAIKGGAAAMVAKGGLLVGVKALALAAAPVVAGVVAAAAVGYAGYRIYKYLKSYKPKDLDTLRFAQYGFVIGDSDVRKKVMTLEEFLMDKVTYNEGKATLEGADFEDQEMLGIFGISQENTHEVDHFKKWYLNRFSPVFLNHLSAIHQVEDGTSLWEVDDLDPPKKAEIAKLVQFPSGEPYKEAYSPIVGRQLDFDYSGTVEIAEGTLGKLTKEAQEYLEKKEARAEQRQKIVEAAKTFLSYTPMGLAMSGAKKVWNFMTGKKGDVAETLTTPPDPTREVTDPDNQLAASGELSGEEVSGLGKIDPKKQRVSDEERETIAREEEAKGTVRLKDRIDRRINALEQARLYEEVKEVGYTVDQYNAYMKDKTGKAPVRFAAAPAVDSNTRQDTAQVENAYSKPVEEKSSVSQNNNIQVKADVDIPMDDVVEEGRKGNTLLSDIGHTLQMMLRVQAAEKGMDEEVEKEQKNHQKQQSNTRQNQHSPRPIVDLSS